MSGRDYEVFDDPYCYRGTFVLKNRAGVKDPKRLEAFELEMSTLRAEEPLPNGRFGQAHYCAVHKHLFGDVYTWLDVIGPCEHPRAATHFAILSTSTWKWRSYLRDWAMAHFSSLNQLENSPKMRQYSSHNSTPFMLSEKAMGARNLHSCT
jgi:hypothetical protein